MATPEPMPREQAPLSEGFAPETDFAPLAEVGTPHLRLVSDNRLPFDQSIETVIDSHASQVEFHRSWMEASTPMLEIHTAQYLMHRSLHKLAVARDIEGYNRKQDAIHRQYLAQRALAAQGE